MLGKLKSSPWALIRAQHETYVDARTGRALWRDYLIFDGTPLVVAGVCAWQDIHLTPAASGSLLTASGLLSVLLFGVMLQVSQRAMDWSDGDVQPSKATTDHALFLRELAANAGYASLVCIAAAVAYVVATMSSGWRLEAASGIGLALGAHVVIVLLMVMKRVFALTEERLLRARTGSGGEVIPHQPRRRRTGT